MLHFRGQFSGRVYAQSRDSGAPSGGLAARTGRRLVGIRLAQDFCGGLMHVLSFATFGNSRDFFANRRGPMEIPTKIALLKDEYLLLQRFYEDFDGRIVTIKGWSVTVGMVAIGGGFYQSRYLWLFASAAALVFWFVESLWKSFQYMYGPRIEAIEAAFRKDEFSNIVPLQIYSSWFKVFEKRGFGFWENVRIGIVAFPHAVILVAGAGLFLLYVFGVIGEITK
jgi:hypothetical protein